MGFLQVLRDQNTLRCVRFGHSYWSEMKWGCAIAGEAGELCNKLKKYERQMPGDPSRMELFKGISDEMADVIIYIDLLADSLGISLERAIQRKFNATSEKHGYPERLPRGVDGQE